ncbi:chemotaxis-related protein WspD [Cupriavidus plantarum]|nr:chemotaxis-related protein WspD [Cupriavidus plantarum]REE90775.1 chemotaxis-related protein WspD [Cupriavidus plantarum]
MAEPSAPPNRRVDGMDEPIDPRIDPPASGRPDAPEANGGRVGFASVAPADGRGSAPLSGHAHDPAGAGASALVRTDTPMLDAKVDAIDDCWRRIGISGDRSCPELAKYVRCRNCPVYANAAVALLDALSVDAPIDIAQMEAATDAHRNAHARGRSCLVFRVGDEWLALPTVVLGEVTAPSPVHSLPHRRHAALLGVAPVRGALLPCLSLALLFDANAVSDKDAQPARGARFLVLGQGRQALALPVEEVAGVHNVPDATLLPLPATLARASSHYTEALFDHDGRTVGLLNAAMLRQALARSLS